VPGMKAYRPWSTHWPPPARWLKMRVLVPPAETTVIGTLVERLRDVAHQT